MMSSLRARWTRKLLLALAKRSSLADLLTRSQRDAMAAVKFAGQTSKAYRTLLDEHRVDLSARQLRFTDLPVLTKLNTFHRFSLAELSRPVPAEQLADVLTSSGRGGPDFGFRLTTRAQFDAASFAIDLGLQDAFHVDQQPTLLVNCLPMGGVQLESSDRCQPQCSGGHGLRDIAHCGAKICTDFAVHRPHVYPALA